MLLGRPAMNILFQAYGLLLSLFAVSDDFARHCAWAFPMFRRAAFVIPFALTKLCVNGDLWGFALGKTIITPFIPLFKCFKVLNKWILQILPDML
jgi:hypothetical protein